MFTQRFSRKLELMLCTLMVFTQPATSSGITLSTMSISFGCLTNCISCSWVRFRTYYTSCTNSWKWKISRINLIINLPLYHDSQAFFDSLHNSIYWNAAPVSEKSSVCNHSGLPSSGPGLEPDRTVQSGLLPGMQVYPLVSGTGLNQTTVPFYGSSNFGSN